MPCPYAQVNGRRLYQEFIVMCYMKMERDRLAWQRANQTTLRREQFAGLQDVMADHDFMRAPRASAIGQPVMLSSSFTGSPRHMHEAYQDAMALVRVLGKPDIFLTMTCNPK